MQDMDQDKSGVKFVTFSFSGREEIVHVVDTCLEQNREIRSSKTNFVYRIIINKIQITCVKFCQNYYPSK